jgi:hypothetical protein
LKPRDFQLCILDFRQRTHAAPVQLRTGFGQAESAGRAVEQPRAELLLEPGDRLADDWLGHVEGFRGCRKARQLNDFDEDRDVREVLHRNKSHAAQADDRRGCGP